MPGEGWGGQRETKGIKDAKKKGDRSPAFAGHPPSLGSCVGLSPPLNCTQEPFNGPFLNGLFSRRFSRGKRSIRGKRPTKGGKRPIKQAKRPTKANRLLSGT